MRLFSSSALSFLPATAIRLLLITFLRLFVCIHVYYIIWFYRKACLFLVTSHKMYVLKEMHTFLFYINEKGDERKQKTEQQHKEWCNMPFSTINNLRIGTSVCVFVPFFLALSLFHFDDAKHSNRLKHLDVFIFMESIVWNCFRQEKTKTRMNCCTHIQDWIW